MRSSSSIVRPGSSTSAQSASVSWTSSPASAMPSISAADLRMIMRAPARCSSASAISAQTSSIERSACTLHKLACCAVVLDDRLRSSRGSCAAAARSPRAVSSARPSMHGALRSAASRADLVGELEQEHDRQRPADLLERASSSASAWARLRGKPSSTKPLSCRRARLSRISGIVISSGTSCPSARSGATCRAELRAGRDRGADRVARRDVRDLVGSRDLLRLRALAGPLRSEDEDVQRRKPS